MKPSWVNKDDVLELAAEELRSELNTKKFGDAILELIDGMDFSQQVDFFGLIRTACERIAKRNALGAIAEAQADRAEYLAHLDDDIYP